MTDLTEIPLSPISLPICSIRSTPRNDPTPQLVVSRLFTRLIPSGPDANAVRIAGLWTAWPNVRIARKTSMPSGDGDFPPAT